MKSSADVTDAVRRTLQAHLPTYLAAGVNGRAPLPEPQSYAEVPTLEAIRRVKRSVLAVSAPRTLNTERSADGSYDATWLVSVAVWHEQADDLPLLTAAGDYTACVRGVLLGHSTLGGFTNYDAVTWREDSTDLVGDERSTQTLGLGITEFAVRVSDVADETPLPTVPGSGPIVLTTNVEVDDTP